MPCSLGKGPRLRLVQDCATVHDMFTIEHEFDATVVTLVDEAGAYLQDDVIITAFEDCVVLEQADADGSTVSKITLSLSQLADLREALNLPEGVYKRKTD